MLEAHRVFAPMNFAMYGLAPCMEYRDGDDLLYINLGTDSCSYRLRVEHQRALVEGARAPPVYPLRATADRPCSKTPRRHLLHEHYESHREQAIVDLLRTYRALEGASYSGRGESGSRDGDRLLYVDGGPWDKSGCDALDDVLKRLRAERPSQWWHVTERYLRCEVRPRAVTLKRSKSGRLLSPEFGPHAATVGEGVRPVDSWLSSELLVVVESWSPSVRLQKVRLGVRSIAGVFPWGEFRWKDLTEAAAA